MSLADVQRRLGVTPDGVWGPKTEKAVTEALWGAERVADPRALDLIKSYEKLKLEAYQDATGKWTIGYGTTADAGVGIVPRPGMKITEAEAEKYLALALEKFAAQIEPGIEAPTTPGEFGAMLSLAYNIGPAAFLNSSVLRKFNDGDKAGAAKAFGLYDKARVDGKLVTLRGLTRRRADEVALFIS